VVEQTDNLVLELLRGLRADMSSLRTDVVADMKSLRADIASEMKTLRADIASDMKSLRADVASDMLNLQKGAREQIAGLRRAVVEYHSAVIGHGMLISDLDERVRRIEQHLDLPSLGGH
jgi:hypothetical protein